MHNNINENTAYLSNINDCIRFTFRNKSIRFRGPYSLVRFKDIAKWDNGYLVVNAFYENHTEPEEDYIDLIPILDNLYIDSRSFLAPIKNVEVLNA